MLTVETLNTEVQEVGWSVVELQLLKEVPLLDGYQESLPARQLQLVVLLLVREAAPYSETVDDLGDGGSGTAIGKNVLRNIKAAPVAHPSTCFTGK